VDADDFKRLQQTADRNCSADPDKRREQEQMAAKLRVAKGDVCVDARNKLADMLEPGRRPTREQLKNQQEFIEAHCKAPVR
jgi:dephospho-CoA kinase